MIATALSMGDLSNACQHITRNVKKFLIFLDTCHSGGLDINVKGVEPGTDLAQALREAEGMFILASAKSGEFSREEEKFRFEGEKRGHGVFTYAILRGLKGEADKDHDGVITVYELSHFVSDLVPQLTRQHPYLKGEGTDIPIFKLE